MAIKFLALNVEMKSCRIAIYAYRLTILHSVMASIDKIVPTTLVPKEVLNKTLEPVAAHPKKANDRLTLAIQSSQILAYYGKRLLIYVVFKDYGKIFRHAKPFASESTALKLYRAITSPMKTIDTNGYASQ